MSDIHTPEWVKHAVFYQIFPDRFARSPRTKHPTGLQFKPWGADPAEQGYQGGDLYGVVDHLDYIQDLGINALYLNPIFSSASNHRYHAFDYFEVDPLLGGDAAFRELLDQAHARGIRVVLDGVFNHASRGFWQFHHVLENGKNSPYVDWFHIDDWPLRPYSSDKDNPPNYASWWGIPALPKLNTSNPAVREFIFEVARYWLDYGIDGWRLDVPAEIDDDEFWREFRRVVKGANPEAYIVGEIWHPAQRWLQGDQYDAVMNYVFNANVLNFTGSKTLRLKDYNHDEMNLGAMDAPQFGDAIDAMHALYDWEINQVQLNLLGSHDTPRALWLVGEDKSALRLALLFQMTMPGSPCIYYGDEIGMTGATDPDCRRAFPWEDQDQWDHELLHYYKLTTRIFHQNKVLRVGNYQRLYAEGEVFAFTRGLDNSRAIIAINAGTEAVDVTIGVDAFGSEPYHQAWPTSGGSFAVDNGQIKLHIPARDGLVLIR